MAMDVAAPASFNFICTKICESNIIMSIFLCVM